MSFDDTLKAQISDNTEIQKALAERLPELLGITGVKGSIIEVGDKSYKAISSYEHHPGYMLAVPLQSEEEITERTVIEPVVLFLPEAKRLAEEITQDPMSIFRRLSVLADDDTLPKDLRDQIKAVNNVIDLMDNMGGGNKFDA